MFISEKCLGKLHYPLIRDVSKCTRGKVYGAVIPVFELLAFSASTTTAAATSVCIQTMWANLLLHLASEASELFFDLESEKSCTIDIIIIADFS